MVNNKEGNHGNSVSKPDEIVDFKIESRTRWAGNVACMKNVRDINSISVANRKETVHLQDQNLDSK
jgi:hypothetical protein